MGGKPERQRRFVEQLTAKYERRRKREGWPVLQAVRSYTETWRIRPQLAGMAAPERKLTRATYLPPRSLLDRLELEASGRAPPPEVRPSPAGDLVFELGTEHCDASSARVRDPQASRAEAAELRPVGSEGAACSIHAPVAAGRWALFVRLKTGAPPGLDSLTLEVDGERPARGSVVGGHREHLAAEGWVWASATPGYPALVLTFKEAGAHTLTLRAAARMVIDQVWLSRVARELPLDNRVLAP